MGSIWKLIRMICNDLNCRWTMNICRETFLWLLRMMIWSFLFTFVECKRIFSGNSKVKNSFYQCTWFIIHIWWKYNVFNENYNRYKTTFWIIEIVTLGGFKSCILWGIQDKKAFFVFFPVNSTSNNFIYSFLNMTYFFSRPFSSW